MSRTILDIFLQFSAYIFGFSLFFSVCLMLSCLISSGPARCGFFFSRCHIFLADRRTFGFVAFEIFLFRYTALTCFLLFCFCRESESRLSSRHLDAFLLRCVLPDFDSPVVFYLLARWSDFRCAPPTPSGGGFQPEVLFVLRFLVFPAIEHQCSSYS